MENNVTITIIKIYEKHGHGIYIESGEDFYSWATRWEKLLKWIYLEVDDNYIYYKVCNPQFI